MHYFSFEKDESEPNILEILNVSDIQDIIILSDILNNTKFD